MKMMNSVVRKCISHSLSRDGNHLNLGKRVVRTIQPSSSRYTYLRNLSTQLDNNGDTNVIDPSMGVFSIPNQSQSHSAITDSLESMHGNSRNNAPTCTSMSSPVPPPPGEEPNRTSLLMELTDGIGILHDILRFFWKYDVNVTRIESRPSKLGCFDFFVDMEGSVGDDHVDKLLASLKKNGVRKLLILDEKQVNWFPRHISELDLIANRTLDAGDDLQADHPGFNDPQYRARREVLAKFSKEYKWDQPIANIEYTDDEVHCWRTVWDKMEPLSDKYACREYKHALNLMKKHCNYSPDAIPQQADISKFLETKTNFRLRPVSGLLSSRDFLNGLAFRVFFCTQYIRHHSKPLYTPEPDICHELLGHAPMFANRDFCDFSQEIGLASLGASDEDVEKLARCYWFSVEFGLCTESVVHAGEKGDDQVKAYGAGLLSSFGELEYACGGREEGDGAGPSPIIKPWDPVSASMQEFPITSYQPIYYLADSLQDAKVKMRSYCEDLQRPFFAQYNDQTQTVFIDRPVKRRQIEKIDNTNMFCDDGDDEEVEYGL